MFSKIAILGALATSAAAVKVAQDDAQQPGAEVDNGIADIPNVQDVVPLKHDQTIQDVIDVHDMVTRIYQDAMQQTIEKIYQTHDEVKDGKLSRKEALNFFYTVLGVVHQDRELAVARYAADLANIDKEAEISRDDMEHFLVNLFTGQYKEHAYRAANNDTGYIE